LKNPGAVFHGHFETSLFQAKFTNIGIEMIPTFDQYHEGFGAELECPKCNGNYLHHAKVEVFDRHEDQPEGLHVVIGDQDVHIDKVLTGNPSARRHGLKIYFSCENCNAVPVLTVAQHKGQTYIDLRNEGPTD
jgi:hypothetical protein